MSQSSHHHLMICHDCDALLQQGAAPLHLPARCRRCGATLHPGDSRHVEPALALSLTGSILFLLAVVNPLLVLKLGGLEQETGLVSGAWALVSFNLSFLGGVVLFTSVLVPGILCFGSLLVFGAIYQKWCFPGGIQLLRGLLILAPWGMVGVYMLGILVAAAKLAGMATLVPGAGLFAFAGLVVVTVLLENRLRDRTLWDKLEQKR